MKNILPALLLSLLASTAFAQTNATPPEQTPAGNPGKLMMKKSAPAAATTTTATDTAAAPMAPVDKKTARKAKRATKVGDKPIN